MRMMMTVQFDTEASNRAIKDGSLPKLMDAALEQLHPESAYFTTHDGARTAFIVIDLQNTSDMPPIAEPFFMGLQAKIDWTPVMNREELKDGLQKLQAAR
jgi:hypothetical protein